MTHSSKKKKKTRYRPILMKAVPVYSDTSYTFHHAINFTYSVWMHVSLQCLNTALCSVCCFTFHAKLSKHCTSDDIFTKDIFSWDDANQTEWVFDWKLRPSTCVCLIVARERERERGGGGGGDLCFLLVFLCSFMFYENTSSYHTYQFYFQLFSFFFSPGFTLSVSTVPEHCAHVRVTEVLRYAWKPERW